jgi:hypothetical protein
MLQPTQTAMMPATPFAASSREIRRIVTLRTIDHSVSALPFGAHTPPRTANVSERTLWRRDPLAELPLSDVVARSVTIFVEANGLAVRNVPIMRADSRDGLMHGAGQPAQVPGVQHRRMRARRAVRCDGGVAVRQHVTQGQRPQRRRTHEAAHRRRWDLFASQDRSNKNTKRSIGRKW